MPKIIKYSIKKRLFDNDETDRKVHRRVTPRFGGVGIFISFITAILFLLYHFISVNYTHHYIIFILSVVLMFILGLVDDISNLKAKNKFFIQFLVSFFLVINKVIYIDNLHGLFGIYELHAIFSIFISTFSIIFIINSYNLIDGIDGLSGILGVLFMVLFIIVFYNSGSFTNIYICVPVIGAIIGFLSFNKSPAKIFMGDSGTMFIGIILAFMAIKVANLSIDSDATKNPVFAISIIFYPVMDAMRVFIKRLIKGRTPFSPDKDHLHHHLLKANLSHMQAVIIIL